VKLKEKESSEESNYWTRRQRQKTQNQPKPVPAAENKVVWDEHNELESQE
jgi:hypothetical protein